MFASIFLYSKIFEENSSRKQLAQIQIPLKESKVTSTRTANSQVIPENNHGKAITLIENKNNSEFNRNDFDTENKEAAYIEEDFKNKVEEEKTDEIVYEPDPMEVLIPKKTIAQNSKDTIPPKSKFSASLGKPLWRVNAVKLQNIEPGPQIAIVIDDAGVDRIRTKHAIALAGPLTISFLPYATDLKNQVKLAKNAGHEIMAHVPMEPFNKQLDPGPNFITVTDPQENIIQKINLALSKVPGSVGINNHMGSRFTSDTRGMNFIMEELRRRGLIFLDSRTSPQTVAPELAYKHQVPFVTRNVFIDHEPILKLILAQLDILENLAKKQGYAVAIAHPRPKTIKALSQWLPVVAEKGLELVPISSIVALRLGLSENRVN